MLDAGETAEDRPNDRTGGHPMNSVWRSSPFIRRAASSFRFMVGFLWQVIFLGGCVLKGFDDEGGCHVSDHLDFRSIASNVRAAASLTLSSLSSRIVSADRLLLGW